MRWPTPQDYNEAVQNPKVNFSDPDLQRGVVALDSLGLPRPISGNFATVYRLTCGDRDWAVRCFLHNFQDQKERYEQIAYHLAKTRPPYLTAFQFVPEGIKVREQWYPILKMEWVEGELLDHFVRRNIGDSARMAALAEDFREMVHTLALNFTAHGDLQHGNILLANDRIRLVDYDGMFVPDLSGFKSNELGHRHYQHPLRRRSHFGSYLDNFSSWVIYVSLLSLGVDPSLYESLGAGEECLLFKDSDFEEPRYSKSFSLLEHHKAEEIRNSAKYLRYLLTLPVEKVPPLTQAKEEPDIEELPEWTDHPLWMKYVLDNAEKNGDQLPLDFKEPAPSIKLVVKEEASNLAPVASTAAAPVTAQSAVGATATASTTTAAPLAATAGATTAASSSAGINPMTAPPPSSAPTSAAAPAALPATPPALPPLPAWTPPQPPQNTNSRGYKRVNNILVALLVFALLYLIAHFGMQAAKFSQKGEFRYEKIVQQADSLREHKQAQKAVDLLLPAIDEAKQTFDGGEPLGDLQLELARSYHDLGKYEEAHDIFNSLLKNHRYSDKSFIEVELEHGKNYLGRKDYDFAANHFSNVIYMAQDAGLSTANKAIIAESVRLLLHTGVLKMQTNPQSRVGLSDMQDAFAKLLVHRDNIISILREFRIEVRNLPSELAESALAAAYDVEASLRNENPKEYSAYLDQFEQVAKQNNHTDMVKKLQTYRSHNK